MIGGDRLRRAGTALGIGLVVGFGFGLRSADAVQADPPLAAARRLALAASAARADAALDALAKVLAGAIDHARKGTAQTVAGDRPPAVELIAAADALAGGAATADEARHEVEVLAGLAAGVAPGVVVPHLDLGSPDLQLVSAGLRTSADAATLFAERRHATDSVVAALGDAVAALDRDDPEAALTSLDLAAAPLAILDAWTKPPPLFSYWRRVIGELIDAARGIATATIAGDPAAQRAAAARYAKAGEAARGADNALAVTLSEEGGAVSVVQLQRLAAAAAAVADARAALVPLSVP